MHEICSVFLRLNNRRKLIYAVAFEKAGYPMAVPSEEHLMGGWQDMHRWCNETFRNAKGRTYTWTGEKFWFQNEADRQKFIARFGTGAAPKVEENDGTLR